MKNKKKNDKKKDEKEIPFGFSFSISLCYKCWCMTRTIDGKCGKCKEPKD